MTEIDNYKVVRQKPTLCLLSAPKHEKVNELLRVFWNEEEIKILSFFPSADKYISLKELAEKSGNPCISDDFMIPSKKKIRFPLTNLI